MQKQVQDLQTRLDNITSQHDGCVTQAIFNAKKEENQQEIQEMRDKLDICVAADQEHKSKMHEELHADVEAQSASDQEHKRKIQEMQEKLDHVTTATFNTKQHEYEHKIHKLYEYEHKIHKLDEKPDATNDSEVSLNIEQLWSNESLYDEEQVIPSKRRDILVKCLQTIFHFLAHVQSAGTMFNVRDAFRHAYMRAHAQKNHQLEYEEADEMARSALQTYKKRFDKSKVPQVLFGSNLAHAMEYVPLSDLMMQVKEFAWYREIQTTIVGNVLLPSYEVHEALILYLSYVRVNINEAVVKKILGVTEKGASTIAMRLSVARSTGRVIKRQCEHLMTKKMRCKKKVKLVTGDSFFPCLCFYHKASMEAINLGV